MGAQIKTRCCCSLPVREGGHMLSSILQYNHHLGCLCLPSNDATMNPTPIALQVIPPADSPEAVYAPLLASDTSDLAQGHPTALLRQMVDITGHTTEASGDLWMIESGASAVCSGYQRCKVLAEATCVHHPFPGRFAVLLWLP